MLLALLAGPVVAQITSRVSLGAHGQPGNGESYCPAISADGRYVAFLSYAHDFVVHDTNGVRDVFVRDRQNGMTDRASIAMGGVQGNGDSGVGNVSISGDGRYVAFVSAATNLVGGDTNGSWDVFVHDRLAGLTSRVSVDSSGLQANGHSRYAAISPDGRFVAFSSVATNLVSGDTNGSMDVFVRDRENHTTERVSLDSSGTQGNGDSGIFVSISDDGRFVAFSSLATNLGPGDTNGCMDVFVRDRQFGLTERVSVDSSSTQGNASSGLMGLSISGDGGFVTFSSDASNLVAGDTNGVSDIFVRDLQYGVTERVSVDSSGAQSHGYCKIPSMSTDGRYVAFSSSADDLVQGDTNLGEDVFLHDRLNHTTERVSVDSTGAQGNYGSGWSAFDPDAIALSPDARYVAFPSDATDLVPVDTNGHKDIYLRDRFGAPNFTSLCDPGFGGVLACPCANPPAGPDRGCDNSASTGGAILSAAGGNSVFSDSLFFTTSGETSTATSIVLQGDALVSSGVVYGQGVRCVGGHTKRLYTKVASGGSITAPEFGAGDPSVTVRSAVLGSVIFPGQSRWYLVFYRDPTVLGGCPAGSTFNATQTGRVDWLP